ncbi:MAG TPA: BREX-2 system adenine-specific DNA-methyltransferase PglX, partial [Acidimicrobiales bacterium]|nr:BREX-2 system adenine-specific DNA-methyltransferase PglX [Acidimicrobiales bacterium]
MIRPKILLNDLQELVRRLEDDLRERCDHHADLDAPLRAEWDKARHAHRTDHPYETWRDDRLTQIGVAWVLAATFVRFCEDNDLIDVRLAGPGERLRLARERRTAHFAAHPAHNDRDYLLTIFEEMAALAPTARLYDRTNPLWELAPSADACSELLDAFTRLGEAGYLAHDFTDPELGTRFLGDLYQDLSEHAREAYALLQTPEFVEEFILDRTLDPAIDDFGLDHTTLIDPACGSGHFLLGAFDRIFSRRRQRHPGANPVEHAIATFGAIAGVDLNPYAVAVARFRLLIAALTACGIRRLVAAPDFNVQVAAGDSLLHGPRAHQLLDDADYAGEAYRHLYVTEDRPLLQRILGQRYTVVVGNPPYITVKDSAANEAYRRRYGSCKGTYSMGVPFTERFFDLTIAPEQPDEPCGYVGMITTNSFMKREFGSKLVEEYLPMWGLSTVIDTSGAYLPGHGTPTVIVIGRSRATTGDTVRAVMGIRGEPSTPADPAKGAVWTAIVDQVDRPGSESRYVVSLDWPRTR